MSDELLQLIVQFAAEAEQAELNVDVDVDVDVDVTLCLGGSLLSGKIVSKNTFLKHHPLTEKMLQFAESSEGDVSESSKSDTPDNLPNFIHLSNAQYYVAGNQPIPSESDGFFVRVKIENIQSFSFGRLAIKPNN